MSHTPGSWTYMYDADGDHAIFAGPKMVAITTGTEVVGSREEDDANARLIAAAPELLEALNATVDYLHELPAEVENAIKAAILKATGGAL